MNKPSLRSFNGSLKDAQGILAIDRATFNDCPYSPEQIVRLLTGGEQRAWVAQVDGDIAGFVTALPTRTLQAESWEVDLLAVHPRHRRRGIGTALIRQAAKGARRARAVVAVKNHASRRAFEAAGFRPMPDPRHLMRCDVAGAAARPPVPGMESIHPLSGEADARGVLRLAPSLSRTVGEVMRLANSAATTLLVTGRDGRISAFVELVQVQTLLYAGAWVEMLVTSQPDEASLLIAAAIERVKAKGLGEIGCLVAARNWRLHQAFVGEGFVSVGEYSIMVRA